MTVFLFPNQLLHKTTETQWFPRPIEEYESSLDALEVEEEAYYAHWRSIAQAPAPDPIGVVSGSSGTGAGATGVSSTSRLGDDHSSASAAVNQQQHQHQHAHDGGAEGSSTSARTRFWNLPRTGATRTSSSSSARGGGVARGDTSLPHTPINNDHDRYGYTSPAVTTRQRRETSDRRAYNLETPTSGSRRASAGSEARHFS